MTPLLQSHPAPWPARRRRTWSRLVVVALLHIVALVLVLRFSSDPDFHPVQVIHDAIHIRDVAIIPPPEKPQPKRVVRAESIPQPLLAPTPNAADPIEIKVADVEPAPVTAPVVAVASDTPRPTPPIATPTRVDAALICPEQSVPEMPRKALIEGIQGVVRAEARVQDGVVKEVRFVAGPAVFYEAVRSAMMKYRCSSHSAMVIAVQEFNFRIN